MALHDSDSSDDDAKSYTTTNILLGYASKEPTDDTISQLGGRPKWLGFSYLPSAALVKCKICNDVMPLLLQLHGDLPEYFPGHERRLYIFGCRRKTCRMREGSMRALRGVKGPRSTRAKSIGKSQNPSPQTQPSNTSKAGNLGNSIFGVASTPFDTGNKNPFSKSAASVANPFASNLFSTPVATLSSEASAPSISSNSTPTDLPKSFTEKVRLSSSLLPPQDPIPPEPWPSESELPTPYPSYHLDADYETLDTPPQAPIPTTALDIDEPGGPSSSSKEDAETFESTLDKTFQRFADRLAQNPLQILRYEFCGTPLLYSKTDSVGKLISPYISKSESGNSKISIVKREGKAGFGAPACESCGAGRVFELQLTPQTIAELEADEMGLDGMEWGTVILGACGVDCGGEGGIVEYVEEWLGVQWEERGK